MISRARQLLCTWITGLIPSTTYGSPILPGEIPEQEQVLNTDERGSKKQNKVPKRKEIVFESRGEIPACLSQYCCRDNSDFKDLTKCIKDWIYE